jgi:urea transport system ATP-binding protein
VIVIEHDMHLVGESADLVSVLHEGKLLGEASMASGRANPEVIRVYLGR